MSKIVLPIKNAACPHARTIQGAGRPAKRKLNAAMNAPTSARDPPTRMKPLIGWTGGVRAEMQATVSPVAKYQSHALLLCAASARGDIDDAGGDVPRSR